MMVRRYVVKDMPEAIALIRRDLGKDAVILSTKKISLKKWFGFWRLKRIEVLAATGDGVPTRVTPERVQDMKKNLPVPTPAVSVPSPAEGSIAPPPQMVVMASESDSEVKLDDVYKEISDVKQLLRSKLSSTADEPVEETLFRHLVRQGLDEEQVRSLFALTPVQQSDVDDASVSVESTRKPEQALRESLGQKILELLQELSHAEPIASTSRIVALVGPTGVGKTTTIAKLAALNVLGGQRKVGLITTDTFRIAAVEQLRTYANILNVPLQVVYQPSELHHALHALADCDLILMDTAGRNFRIDRNVVEMKHILSAVPVDETYLVLSMTSKPDDLDKVAAVFQELPVDKFLFTKMDETSTYGAILNLMMTYRKPISYVTTGQNVPDDIEVANVEKVLRLIFGGAA